MPVLTPNIPDGLTDLMKSLAKSVLREKPENVNEFAAVYFEKLLLERDGSIDKGFENFTLYDKYFEGRAKYDITYSKRFVCNCNEKKNLTISQSKKSKKLQLQRQRSVKNPEILMPIQEEDKVSTKYQFDDHHINAIYVIQRYIRKYLVKKRSLKNSKINEKIPYKLSEENAAIIIQRTIRKIFLENLSTKPEQKNNNIKIVKENSQMDNLEKEPPEKEQDDNVSEAASYTSSSTIQLMSNTPEINENLKENEINNIQISEVPIESIKEQESIEVDLNVYSETICNESEEAQELSNSPDDKHQENKEPKTMCEKLQENKQLLNMEDIDDRFEEQDDRSANFDMIQSIGNKSQNLNTTTEVTGGDILESTDYKHNKNKLNNLENENESDLKEIPIKKSQVSHLRPKRSVMIPRTHNMEKFQPKILSDGETYEYFEIPADGISSNIDSDTNNLKNVDESDKDDFEYPDSLNNSYAEKDSLDCDINKNCDEQDLDSIEEYTSNLNIAALKIQKVFRGYVVRKSINKQNMNAPTTDINSFNIIENALEKEIKPNQEINKETLILTRDNDLENLESNKNDALSDNKKLNINLMTAENANDKNVIITNNVLKNNDKENNAANIIQAVYRMYLIKKSLKNSLAISHTSFDPISLEKTFIIGTLPSMENNNENERVVLSENNDKLVKGLLMVNNLDKNDKNCDSKQVNNLEIILPNKLYGNSAEYSFNFTEEPIVVGLNDDLPLVKKDKDSQTIESIVSTDCDLDIEALKKAMWFVGEDLIIPTPDSRDDVDISHPNLVKQESSLSRAIRLTPNLKSFTDAIEDDNSAQNSLQDICENVNSNEVIKNIQLTSENRFLENESKKDEPSIDIELSDKIIENSLVTKNFPFDDTSIKSSIESNHFLHEQLLGDIKLNEQIQTNDETMEIPILDNCENKEPILENNNDQVRDADDKNAPIFDEINQTKKNVQNFKNSSIIENNNENKIKESNPIKEPPYPQTDGTNEKDVDLNDTKSFDYDAKNVSDTNQDKSIYEDDNNKINDSLSHQTQKEFEKMDLEEIPFPTVINMNDLENMQSLNKLNAENYIHLTKEFLDIEKRNADKLIMKTDFDDSEGKTFMISTYNSNETFSDKKPKLLEKSNDTEDNKTNISDTKVETIEKLSLKNKTQNNLCLDKSDKSAEEIADNFNKPTKKTSEDELKPSNKDEIDKSMDFDSNCSYKVEMDNIQTLNKNNFIDLNLIDGITSLENLESILVENPISSEINGDLKHSNENITPEKSAENEDNVVLLTNNENNDKQSCEIIQQKEDNLKLNNLMPAYEKSSETNNNLLIIDESKNIKNTTLSTNENIKKAFGDINKIGTYKKDTINQNTSEINEKVDQKGSSIYDSKLIQTLLETSSTDHLINGTLNSLSPNSSVEESKDILKSFENLNNLNNVNNSTVVSKSSLIATSSHRDRTVENINQIPETVSAIEKEEIEQKSVELSEDTNNVSNDNILVNKEMPEDNVIVIQQFKNDFNKTFIKDTNSNLIKIIDSVDIEKNENDSITLDAINNIQDEKLHDKESNNEFIQNDSVLLINTETDDSKVQDCNDINNESDFEAQHEQIEKESEIYEEPCDKQQDEETTDYKIDSCNKNNGTVKDFNTDENCEKKQLETSESKNEDVNLKPDDVLEKNETTLIINKSETFEDKNELMNEIAKTSEIIAESSCNINQNEVSKEIHDVLEEAQNAIKFLEIIPNVQNVNKSIEEDEELCQNEDLINEVNKIDNIDIETSMTDLTKTPSEEINENNLLTKTPENNEDKTVIVGQKSEETMHPKDGCSIEISNEDKNSESQVVENVEFLKELKTNSFSEKLTEVVDKMDSDAIHRNIPSNDSDEQTESFNGKIFEEVPLKVFDENNSEFMVKDVSEDVPHVLSKREINENTADPTSNLNKSSETQIEDSPFKSIEEFCENNNSSLKDQDNEKDFLDFNSEKDFLDTPAKTNEIEMSQETTANFQEANQRSIATSDNPLEENISTFTKTEDSKDILEETKIISNLEEIISKHSINVDIPMESSLVSVSLLNPNEIKSNEADEITNLPETNIELSSADRVDAVPRVFGQEKENKSINKGLKIEITDDISLDDYNHVSQTYKSLSESKDNTDDAIEVTTENGTLPDRENIVLIEKDTNILIISSGINKEVTSGCENDEEKFNLPTDSKLSASLTNDQNNEAYKLEGKATLNIETAEQIVSAYSEEKDKLTQNVIEHESKKLSLDTESYINSDNTNVEDIIKCEKVEIEEEPCLKKTVSMSHLPVTSIYEDLSEIERIDISKYSADSLEGMYYSLRKNELMLDRMQRRASEHKISPKENDLINSFGIYPCETVKSLNIETSTDTDDDIILKELEREFTIGKRTSQDNDDDANDELLSYSDREIMKQSKTKAIQKMHTIGGESNFKVDGESKEETRDDSFLDESTSMNIREKMLAFSVSEEDSDGCEIPEQRTNALHDDFNISTALLESIVSTDTDSTIISAATKIQAGARGFITRRRLRRASDSTKASLSDLKSSFGNEAISESLENLVEEESAKKIQKTYRQYRKNKELHQNSLANAKIMNVDEFQNICNENEILVGKDDSDDRLAEIINEYSQRNNNDDDIEKTERKFLKNATYTSEFNENDKQLDPPINFDGTLAARRMTLHRGDAVQKDSIRDDENSRSSSSSDKRAENILTTKTNTKKSSDAEKFRRLKKFKMLGIRQNSMPVQIDSEVLRVIPKHLRKRIKSADGQKKRRTNFMQ